MFMLLHGSKDVCFFDIAPSTSYTFVGHFQPVAGLMYIHCVCVSCGGRFSRGLKRKPLALIKRLRKAKKECPELEKPACIKTHLRNMIVVPEMIGSVVGIHNGKTFNQVEIKVRSSVDGEWGRG